MGRPRAPAMTTRTPKRYLRRQKLPLPTLQWKLIGCFVGLSALSLLLQYVLISSRLSQLAASMPSGSEYLANALPRTMGAVLAFSMLALLPMSAAIGVLITFRWAGPLYRFHVYLRQVAEGEAQGPCRIREKDELQELCGLINRALEATQARAKGSGPAQESPAAEARGATLDPAA